jgi:hypothetical protein
MTPQLGGLALLVLLVFHHPVRTVIGSIASDYALSVSLSCSYPVYRQELPDSDTKCKISQFESIEKLNSRLNTWKSANWNTGGTMLMPRQGI